MKKVLLGITGALTLLLALGAWQINRWMDTPHGRLTAPAAVLLQLAALVADPELESDPVATRAARHKSRFLVTGVPTAVFKVEDLSIADPARDVVAGDSAGGNLAAVVSQLSRDRAGPQLRAQVLLYPALDLSRLDRQSTTDFASGFLLTRERMGGIIDIYVPDKATRSHPMASPLLASNLQDLAPAIIVTAQFDVLRDEGEEYAAALRNAGVPVRSLRVDGMIHGFLSMDRWFPEAGETSGWVAEQLGEMLR